MKNKITENLIQLDAQLAELVSKIDILDAVAPLNYREEKELFLANHYSKNPKFAYKKNEIPLFLSKRALYNIPIDQLKDPDLFNLYADIIDSYADKLSQFQSIGSEKFLYDSLRYYGEPTERDINNAKFILHLPVEPTTAKPDMLNADDIVFSMTKFAEQHNYPLDIELSNNMVANALVSGLKVKVNTNAKLTSTEVKALAHHELGVHLATSLNGKQQPLKILSLGCPMNTLTQEGIAILCEYLAGFLTLPRLKVLALRVLAVSSMIKEKDFKTTFSMLVDDYHVSEDLAFTITARVYRGGGFTKDYLYLTGFSQLLASYKNEKDFNNLLAGKVSLSHLPVVTRLINKGYLVKPVHISPALKRPMQPDKVLQFVANAIV